MTGNKQHMRGKAGDLQKPGEAGRLRGFLTNALLSVKVIAPVMIILAAVVAYGALKASKPTPPKPKQVEKVWAVMSQKAIAQTITPTLNLYGKTVSRRQVELRALVAGKIIETGPGLKEGAVVKKGDVLLTIDDFDYKGALREAEATLSEAIARREELEAGRKLEQQNLAYAKDQLALAERDFKRVEDLSKRGTVTKKLADDRKVIVSQRAQAVASHQINLDLQKARLDGQKATIKRLEWKVEQAKRRLEETRLIAPFNAYVSTVSAEIGRTVNVNDRIANLIDTDRLDVRFNLTDAQYGRILSSEGSLIGRPLQIVWRVGGKPQTYNAVVVRIGAEIASDSGGVEIYAAIETGAGALPIRTGAFVEVSINDRQYKGIYRLPQTAIYDGNTIYTIVEDRLTPIKAEIVGYAGSDSLVQASLPKGADILTTRLTLAGEGVKVKIQNESELLIGKKGADAGRPSEGL